VTTGFWRTVMLNVESISQYFCASFNLSVTRLYLSKMVDWIDLIIGMVVTIGVADTVLGDQPNCRP